MSLDTVPDFAQGSTIGVLVPAGWTTHAPRPRTAAQPEAIPA